MSNPIESVGAIQWEELFINFGGGVIRDLRANVKNIKIYENIFQTCLSAELAVHDSTGMLGSLEINGLQTITMKLKSPFLSDEQAIHKTFAIASISDRLIGDDRQEIFIFKLISLEGMKDLSTRFSKRFVGGTDEMAEQIFRDSIVEPRYFNADGTFGGDTPLLMLGKPHKTNNFAFTATNWSAFQCMNFLAKNSEPADVDGKSVMPNTLFFERRSGFVFGTITELAMLQKKSYVLYDEYNYVPSLDIKFANEETRTSYGEYSYTSPFISKQYCVASDVDMREYFNELKNQKSGYYGSTTIGVDMVNRLNYQMIFDYTENLNDNTYRNRIQKTYDDFIHLAEDRPTVEKPIFSPAAKTKVNIAASNLYDDSEFGFTLNHFERTTFRNSAFAELKRLRLKLTVPGKTDIDVGNLVRFNFPLVGDRYKGMSYEDIFDPLVSGIYIVTGIVHNITQEKHNMRLELCRDSYGPGM